MFGAGDTHAPLPGVLAEIADAAGYEAALLVAKAKGGTRAYFPRNPDNTHWLTELLGHDRARLVCEQLTLGDVGLELEVPIGPAGSRSQRWRVMRDMIEAGMSKPAIASATGVSHKTVQRHKAKLRRGDEDDAQGELF